MNLRWFVILSSISIVPTAFSRNIEEVFQERLGNALQGYVFSVDFDETEQANAVDFIMMDMRRGFGSHAETVVLTDEETAALKSIKVTLTQSEKKVTLRANWLPRQVVIDNICHNLGLNLVIDLNGHFDFIPENILLDSTSYSQSGRIYIRKMEPSKVELKESGEITPVLLGYIKRANDAGFHELSEDNMVNVSHALPGGEEDETWAILQLYRWKKFTEIGSQWWLSKDPANRILIMMCLTKEMSKEGKDEFVHKLKGNAIRFAGEEAKQRLEEITLYQKLRSNNLYELLGL